MLVALAKMSFEPAHLASRDLTSLTESERKVLDDWETKLASKYPVVGELI
jgi:hypothetical protein